MAEPALAQHYEIIWLQDASGSMHLEQAMQQVNLALERCLSRPALLDPSQVRYHLSLATYSDNAVWHYRGTPMAMVSWNPLPAGGVTEMGKGLHLVLSRLEELKALEQQAVLVLASDGMPTDEYEVTLQQVVRLCQQAGYSRYVLALGPDVDQEMLQSFQPLRDQYYSAKQSEQIDDVIDALFKRMLTDAGAPVTPVALTARSESEKQPETYTRAEAQSRFLTDYLEQPSADFMTKYQRFAEFTKLGLANRAEFIRGQSARFEIRPTGFVAVAWKAPDQMIDIQVLPNPQMRYQEKLYKEMGLSEIFDSSEAMPSHAFKPVALEPALFSLQGEQWVCSQRGRVTYKRE